MTTIMTATKTVANSTLKILIGFILLTALALIGVTAIINTIL